MTSLRRIHICIQKLNEACGYEGNVDADVLLRSREQHSFVRRTFGEQVSTSKKNTFAMLVYIGELKTHHFLAFVRVRLSLACLVHIRIQMWVYLQSHYPFYRYTSHVSNEIIYSPYLFTLLSKLSIFLDIKQRYKNKSIEKRNVIKK